MREQFLRDNQEKPDEDNYELKRRDNADKVSIIEGIDDPQKKEKTEDKVTLFIYLFLALNHVCFRS